MYVVTINFDGVDRSLCSSCSGFFMLCSIPRPHILCSCSLSSSCPHALHILCDPHVMCSLKLCIVCKVTHTEHKDVNLSTGKHLKGIH